MSDQPTREELLAVIVEWYEASEAYREASKRSIDLGTEVSRCVYAQNNLTNIARAEIARRDD